MNGCTFSIFCNLHNYKYIVCYRVLEMKSQLCVTLYLYIYPFAHKQLRRHLPKLFINSPVRTVLWRTKQPFLLLTKMFTLKDINLISLALTILTFVLSFNSLLLYWLCMIKMHYLYYSINLFIYTLYIYITWQFYFYWEY